MPSNLKVFLGPVVGLCCRPQRIAASCGKFSNVRHALLQIKLWWLKSCAGKSQRIVFKNKGIGGNPMKPW